MFSVVCKWLIGRYKTIEIKSQGNLNLSFGCVLRCSVVLASKDLNNLFRFYTIFSTVNLLKSDHWRIQNILRCTSFLKYTEEEQKSQKMEKEKALCWLWLIFVCLQGVRVRDGYGKSESNGDSFWWYSDVLKAKSIVFSGAQVASEGIKQPKLKVKET